MSSIVYMDNRSGSCELNPALLRTDWHFWLWTALWTFTVLGILMSIIPSFGEKTRQLVMTEAWGHLGKDPAAVFGAISLGSVHLPATKGVSENPFLSDVPEMDIHNPPRKAPPLIHPIYTLPQVMEWYSEVSDEVMRYLREGTAQDRQSREDPFLCLTEPIMTGEDCLKCHDFKGYKEKNIRPAFNISMPLRLHPHMRIYGGIFDLSY